MKLIFMLEEPSAQRFLEAYLPRWRADLDFLCIPHQGKQDLEKSVSRKLKAWQDPSARFVVLRDNDGADCTRLKSHLSSLCTPRPGTLVRLACQELEAWFLGDLGAVARTFSQPKLAQLQDKAKFRDPDHIGSPSTELDKLLRGYRKLQGAAALGLELSLEANSNRSRSFQAFMSGLTRILGETG